MVTKNWALKNIASLFEGSKDVKTRFTNTSQGSFGGTLYRLVTFKCYKRIRLYSTPKVKNARCELTISVYFLFKCKT